MFYYLLILFLCITIYILFYIHKIEKLNFKLEIILDNCSNRHDKNCQITDCNNKIMENESTIFIKSDQKINKYSDVLVNLNFEITNDLKIKNRFSDGFPNIIIPSDGIYTLQTNIFWKDQQNEKNQYIIINSKNDTQKINIRPRDIKVMKLQTGDKISLFVNSTVDSTILGLEKNNYVATNIRITKNELDIELLQKIPKIQKDNTNIVYRGRNCKDKKDIPTQRILPEWLVSAYSKKPTILNENKEANESTTTNNINIQKSDELTKCNEDNNNKGNTPKCDKCDNCNIGNTPKCNEDNDNKGNTPKCDKCNECDKGDTPKCNEDNDNKGNTPKCDIGNTPKCDIGNTPKCDIGNTPKCDIGNTPKCDIGNTPKCNEDNDNKGNTPKCNEDNPKCDERNIGDTPKCDECNIGDTPKCNEDNDNICNTPKCDDNNNKGNTPKENNDQKIKTWSIMSSIKNFCIKGTIKTDTKNEKKL